jgi:hypothetical protein
LVVVVTVAVLGTAVLSLVWILRLPLDRRTGALTVAGYVITLTLATITVLTALRTARRVAAPATVDALAEAFASAVYGQWRQTADDRALSNPAPLSIPWTLSPDPVAGPVIAAVGRPDSPPRYNPFPGHTRTTVDDLEGGGRRQELGRVFGGLSSGRLVVIGEPGSGKTSTGILLLLDILSYRDTLDDKQRSRVPVPILLNAQGWNPTRMSVVDWIAREMTLTYPLFQHRGGSAEAIQLLRSNDRVALLLDGFDELDEALRPSALVALGSAPFRVVLLSRRAEMARAARTNWLVGAAVVALQPVEWREASDYLHDSLGGPKPIGWDQLVNAMETPSRALLSSGLFTPLVLTLIRDTYDGDDDVSTLLVVGQEDEMSLQQRTMARVLPAAYGSRHGTTPSRYDVQTAERVLTALATELHARQQQGFGWWEIAEWASKTPRVVAATLFFGIVFGAAHVVVAIGQVPDFSVVFIPGFALGALLGALHGTVASLLRGPPRNVGRSDMKVLHIARSVTVGTVGGLLVGLAILGTTVLFDSVYGTLYGTLFGIGSGVGLFLYTLFNPYDTAGSAPLRPQESWRSSRNSGIWVGLAAGAAVGTQIFAVDRLHFGLPTGLFEGAAFGLAIFATFGLFGSRTWSADLAWCQFALSRRLPYVRIINFLHDAEERGVLRSVGSVYQFRHTLLQDQLTVGLDRPRRH